ILCESSISASCGFGQSEAVVRQTDQLPQANGFSLGHAPAQGCDPVIAPPSIVEVRVRPIGEFLDQTLFQHPVDGAVMRAGPQVQLPAARRSTSASSLKSVG